MRNLWLAGLCLSLGCASAPVKPIQPVNFDAADAKRRDGCYDCLIEARDIYQRAAAGPARPAALQRWFETELLIALRERELALENSVALGRARTLSAELAPDLTAGRYVTDVDQVPHEGAGWSRKDTATFRQSHMAFAAGIEAELAWIRAGALDPLVRDYVALSLDCSYRNRARPPGQPAPRPPEVPEEGPPLLRYRLAWCGQLQLKALDTVREEVPGFVETSYFQGAVAVASIERGGGPNPHTHVADVVKRFGDSPAVTMLAGNLYQTVGDCPQALTAFDKTVALQPTHEDAWLGRTTCLTELQKTEEAIAAATQMIERGLDNADLGFYWRAWNHHGIGNLPAARADIDAARARRVNADNLTLAGVIEHDQNDLALAQRDLDRAIEISVGLNCRARWYQGAVFVKREMWRDAAPAFDRAMTCYDQDAHYRELLLGEVEANPVLDPDYKRARASRLREQIQAQRYQQFSAAFNAANFYFWSGDIERAEALVAIAAKAPELSAEVARLRKEMVERTASRRPGPS